VNFHQTVALWRSGDAQQCRVQETCDMMACMTRAIGTTSPGRSSHSDTTLYISSVILHTKYTGLRETDFNVHA
jgi:hypothetical protein